MLLKSLLVLALTIQIMGIPLDPIDEVVFMEDIVSSSENQSQTTADKVQSLQNLGVTDEFLEELKINLEKAIEQEKQDQRLRQGFNGVNGGIGDLYGLGNGGGNGNGGFGNFGNNQGGQEDEEDDEDLPSTSPGPGAFGILSGLFGIFSGLGSLNPRRVIQSTVNFFPPDRRVLAQMALDDVFGIHNVTTLRPLTDAPPKSASSSTTVKPEGRENDNSTTDSIMKVDVNVNATTEKMTETTTNRRSIILKGISLEEDFDEAASLLNPKGDKEKDKTSATLSTLEKDFAETAEKFKIGSLSDELEPTNTTEKADKYRINSIAQDFQNTGNDLRF